MAKNKHKKGNKEEYIRRSPYVRQPEAKSEELRPVFAAYFNMARANLYSVLQHISVQCGLSIKEDEEHMIKLPVANFADKIKQPEVQDKIYKLLMRHIPALQFMTQAYITKGKTARKSQAKIEKHIYVEYADLQKILQNIISVVDFKRNYFTHADHYDKEEEIQTELEHEKALYIPFDYAFKGSKREAKRIFGYKPKEMEFVDQKERMNSIPKLDTSGNPTYDDKGRKQYIFVEHQDWYFRLFDTTPNKTTKMPQPDNLSTAGLVFLLCKLLHKRYATQLAQQTGLFRVKKPDVNNLPIKPVNKVTTGTNSNKEEEDTLFTKTENEVMFNIFCAHRIRLPKGRMDSSANDTALGLDMLNELQKCPSELFDTFCPEDKKLFQVKRKDGEAIPDPDDDINLFRRNGDRFPQLALKYIDTMRNADDERNRVLKDIVFQVSLGKFRHSFYNRASLDTSDPNRVRVLQKEINGFGPIDIIEELRKEKYQNLIRPVSDDPNHLYDVDTADTKPYLTDQYAHYAITGDRIGLMWNIDNEEKKLNTETLCFLPELPEPQPTTDNKKPWQVGAIEHNLIPRAWLSVYDLPALMFLHFLGGDPEKEIKEAYKRTKKLLSNVSRGEYPPDQQGYEKALKNIKKRRDIPQKVLEYFSSDNDQNAEKRFIDFVNDQLNGHENKDTKQFVMGIIARLENQLKRFNKGLEQVGDKQNRIGRKEYVEVRPGSLARYIAKDIMAMTRPCVHYEAVTNDTGNCNCESGSKCPFYRDGNKCKNGAKPSGMDFAVLQSSIATFKSNGKKLEDTDLGKMLSKAILVKDHPFLDKVTSKNVHDAVELYTIYIQEKINFLKRLLNGEEGEYKDQWFLREAYRNHVAKTAEYMQGENGLASRYFDTLMLPDGLFTDAIRRQLKSSDNPHCDKPHCDNPHIKTALENVNRNSASYLLNVYFTKVLNDKSQPFYRNQGDLYKRHYKLFNTLYPTQDGSDTYFDDNEIASKLRKDGKQSNVRKVLDEYIEALQMITGSHKEKRNGRNGEYTVKIDEYGPADKKTKQEERTKLMHQLRDLQRNERTIRRFRNEDMIFFLMAKKLLLTGGVVFSEKEAKEDITKFRLQDILPPGCKSDKDKSILEQQVSFELTIGLVNEKGKHINSPDGNQIKRTVKQDKIKLKNYGDFYTFLYDSRIGSLLSQLPDRGPVDRDNLEKELDTYDRKRHDVFRILQAIEKIIIEDNPGIRNESDKQFRDNDGKIRLNSFSSLLNLCKEYLKDDGKPTDVSNLLVEIRNSFSHNRYVYSDNKLLKITELSLPKVADHIINWLDNHQKQQKVTKR